MFRKSFILFVIVCFLKPLSSLSSNQIDILKRTLKFAVDSGELNPTRALQAAAYVDKQVGLVIQRANKVTFAILFF